MPYRIEWRPAARRGLFWLERDAQTRVFRCVDALAGNPRPDGCRKLTGRENLYRVRVGDYRILYEVRDAVLVVLVVEIEHRREVYR